MGPKPTTRGSGDLYRSRLDQILNHRHELFRLAGMIAWERFDREFGRFYRPTGRPANPTRLMVGLSYLKHTFNLSDEAVVMRWTENPYWQWFCGCEFFQHDLPCDASSLTRWRKRVGPEGMEKLLAATIQVGLDSGAVRPSYLERISVDTTVQPKAIKAHRPYEFGSKVAVAVTNREGFALASKALEGNPYDGHTLKAAIERVIAMTGVEPERAYVDRGYRGHDYARTERVFIAGQRRGITPTIRRELKRRSAIEAMIGHMKEDGRLARNHLLGTAGDAMNALLVAAGHNLRLIPNWLRLLLAWFSAALINATAQPDTSQAA